MITAPWQRAAGTLAAAPVVLTRVGVPLAQQISPARAAVALRLAAGRRCGTGAPLMPAQQTPALAPPVAWTWAVWVGVPRTSQAWVAAVWMPALLTPAGRTLASLMRALVTRLRAVRAWFRSRTYALSTFRPYQARQEYRCL
jgi:hypothetical protein